MFLLLLIISVGLQQTTQLSDKCPLYSKQKLEKKECIYQRKPGQILLQKCPINMKCDIKEGDCIDSKPEYSQPAFPGGKCSKDSDCLSYSCENGKCQGSKNCKSHSDCEFGFNCLDNKCSYPKPSDAQCKETWQCEVPLMCYKGKCVKPFSFPDGKEDIDEEFALLCKSGKVYNRKCNSLKNVNIYCDEEQYQDICYYKDAKNNNVKVSSTCICEYNMNNTLNGRKRCILGDKDNEIWEKVINIYKKTIEPKNTKFCNSGEKRPGYCRELLRNDWSIRKEQILLDKYILEAQYSGHLPIKYNEKDLILSTVFSYDNTPPQPRNGFKCPKYVKGNEKYFSNNVCAYGNNPFTEYGENITVFVNPNKCGNGFKCKFEENKLYEQWEYNATCVGSEKNNDYPGKKIFKFPGESCNDKNEKCIFGSDSDIGKCENGKCTGHSEKGKCERHEDCLIGLFCNKTSKECQKQKKAKEFCDSIESCQNDLLCMNNTCFEYFSLTNGTFLEENNGNKFISLCKYEFIDEETNQCIDNLEYYGLNDEQILNKGVVECSLGNKCNYTSGFEGKIYTLECQCGYNPFGRSFCPLSHRYEKNNRQKYINIKRKIYKSNCHTLRRFECINKEKVEKANYYKRKSLLAHLFYLSTSEVQTNLSSQFIHINLWKIIALISIFLIM